MAVAVLWSRWGESTGALVEAARSAAKPEERLSAIDRLATVPSEEASAVLAEAAQDPSPEVATRAVLALGRRADPKTLPTLRTVATKDPRPAVREAGVVAVGRLGARTDPEVLVQALRKDPSARVRATAAKWIGLLRYWEGMPALIEGLRDEDLRVRQAAYGAIRRLWGRDFLYRADAPPEEREARIRLIEGSWESYRASRNFKMFRWRKEGQP